MAIIGVDALIKELGSNNSLSINNASDLMELLLPLKAGEVMPNLVSSINQRENIEGIFITSIFHDRNMLINCLKLYHGFDFSDSKAIDAFDEMITKVVTNSLFSKKSLSEATSESFLSVADDIWSSLGERLYYATMTSSKEPFQVMMS